MLVMAVKFTCIQKQHTSSENASSNKTYTFLNDTAYAKRAPFFQTFLTNYQICTSCVTKYSTYQNKCNPIYRLIPTTKLNASIISLEFPFNHLFPLHPFYKIR